MYLAKRFWLINPGGLIELASTLKPSDYIYWESMVRPASVTRTRLPVFIPGSRPHQLLSGSCKRIATSCPVIVCNCRSKARYVCERNDLAHETCFAILRSARSDTSHKSRRLRVLSIISMCACACCVGDVRWGAGLFHIALCRLRYIQTSFQS